MASCVSPIEIINTVNSAIMCDSDILLCQTSLDWILGIEKLLDLFQAPASGLYKEKVDYDNAKRIPYDVQDIELPSWASDSDRGHVGVHDFNSIVHETQVSESFGSGVVREDFAGIEGLHRSLKMGQQHYSK